MSTQPKVLCLFSTPLVKPNNEPLDILDVETEHDDIVESLKTCNRQVLLRTRYATVQELAAGVRDGFNILHISCHGRKDSLLFEDGKSGSHLINGDYLKKLLSLKKSFKLVVVSACHSELIAEKLVEAGVQHVISIRRDTPVLDHAAKVFTAHFYANLFRGDTVQEAFEMAKLLVEGDPDLSKVRPHLEFIADKKGEPFVPEEDKFLLLPRDSTHSDPFMSEEVPEGELIIDKCFLSKTNLPVRSQSFTGRSVDMHKVIKRIFDNRLVTITGVGGIGKTTLAREVARWFHLRGYFPDGIYNIDLREVENADGIIALLGGVLEVPLAEPKDVGFHLQGRQCLFLLDNAEDVLRKDKDAVHNLFDYILQFAPNIKFLVTSQQSIGGVLHEPEHIHRLHTLEQLFAVLLFLKTTRREMSEEELKSDAFPHLLDKLGGHPLSIVLMARQLVHGVTLEDLVQRIETYKAKAITIKGITGRDLQHGQSLAASLTSAYSNLSENAQTLFGILSLLPAGGEGFILKDIYGDAVWEYAQELSDASLAEIVTVVENVFRRVILLPPVRLFAMSIPTDKTRKEYGPKIVEVMGEYAATYYENLGTKEAIVYRFLFAMEEPNFRSAIELPCSPPQSKKDASSLGILAPSLILLYVFSYRYQEAREIGDVILSNLGKLQDWWGTARTLESLGDLAKRVDDLKEAKENYESALKIYQEIEENWGTASTLKSLGDLAKRVDDLKGARENYERALKIYQEIENNLGTANTLLSLGDLAKRVDDLKGARENYERALKIYQEIEDNLGTASTLLSLGDLAKRVDDLKGAKENYERALKIYQEIEDNLGTANTLRSLGDLANRVDDLKEAKENYESVLKIYQEIENNLGTANTLKSLGDLALKTNTLEDAKDKYEKALEIYQEIDDKWSTANAIMGLGYLSILTDELNKANKYLDDALKIFKEVNELAAQADIHIGRAVVLFKCHTNSEAKQELDKCSSILDKVFGYGETAQWIIFFADHLKQHGFKDGARICLEYAKEFANKAKDPHLQKKVNQQLSEVR